MSLCDLHTRRTFHFLTAASSFGSFYWQFLEAAKWNMVSYAAVWKYSHTRRADKLWRWWLVLWVNCQFEELFSKEICRNDKTPLDQSISPQEICWFAANVGFNLTPFRFLALLPRAQAGHTLLTHRPSMKCGGSIEECLTWGPLEDGQHY